VSARRAALTVLALVTAAHLATADAAAPEPLSVRGTFTPSVIRFADPLVADVEVAYDPRIVDGRSIRVVPDFGPFVETSAPEVSHERRDGLDVLRTRYALQCLTAGCLPPKNAMNVQLPRLTVTGTRDGRAVSAVGVWPALRVVSRVSEHVRAGQVVFRRQRILPPPAYRVSPGALAGGLIAAAALALVAAVALLAIGLRRRRGRSDADALSALERALWFTRDSATRPDPADRRRALELLAEAVEEAGDDRLAGRVRNAAWVETPPTPQRSTELAGDVEVGTNRA
jgi:hypothetical protein